MIGVAVILAAMVPVVTCPVCHGQPAFVHDGSRIYFPYERCDDAGKMAEGRRGETLSLTRPG